MLNTLTEPGGTTAVDPALWDKALATSARLGARLDCPSVEEKGRHRGRWLSRIAWSSGNPPEARALLGYGDTPSGSPEALIAQVDEPVSLKPHCPTCNCSSEVLANG